MYYATSVKKLGQSLTLASIILTLSGCIIHVGDGYNDDEHGNGVSSVFGDLSVSQGKEVADVDSVNGDIELANAVTARHVDTVNGSIEIGSSVTVRSAETVNGDIDVQHGFYSNGVVETVNGDIHIRKDSSVDDDIKTVNGDIQLEGVSVTGDLHTNNGDIQLFNGTSVSGDVVFHRNNNRRSSFEPTLRIDQSSAVEGQIILYRKVNLEIDDAELLRKVQYEYGDAQ